MWKTNVIPRNERLYKECNTVEDEYRFVCECSLYVDLRWKYIPVYYKQRPVTSLNLLNY